MRAKDLLQFYIFFTMIQGSLLNKIVVPNLNGYCYSSKGHINMGVLIALSERGDNELCSEKLSSIRNPQSVEIVKYALFEINSREDILPNITLGYSILDTCNRDIVALARSLRFIHSSENENEQTDNSTISLDEYPTSYKLYRSITG